MSLLLDVDGLKTYLRAGSRIVQAVDDVSFQIKKGETVCLVGESGSGKSVCALSIIRLLPQGIATHPAGGIRFNFRHNEGEIEQVDMLTLQEERLREIRGSRIAMIFQEPMTSLNPVFTIGDQIIEALQLHWPHMSYDDARNRTIEALRQVQIPDAEQRVNEYPHRLSGGQRQRVMIAMAMACEPDLLIADEPTTALDVTVQAEILRLMKELQKNHGTSILFITHDFGVVSQMADQVAVMRRGKIVENGALDQVLHKPEHEYTKQLLAALPENLERDRHAFTIADASILENSGNAASVNSENSTTAGELLLQLRGLQVYFPIRTGVFRHTTGHVKAVDDVDMEIRRGEILALVGESGCGKTTLGRAILNLISPTAGEVAYQGAVINQLSGREFRPFRRQLQIIFQDPMSSLNPRLTVASTLVEPMAVHGIGADKEDRLSRAAAVLESVGLEEEHLWRYPHEFSGGQRQRIGIARALVLEPQFIVCDEVTSALDVSVQAEILKILLELRAQKNLTLLFITHNISVVEFLSDRMAVMREGKVLEFGNTADIGRAPQHEYTQRLLDAVPRVPVN